MLQCPRPHSTIALFRNVAPEQWSDWKWQLKNRITNEAQLSQVVNVSDGERRALREGTAFRFGITPHYATLMDPDDPKCPIRTQAIPTPSEMLIAPEEMVDSLAEDSHSPAPNVTHRYPDRVLFLLTHECALYCRYCTRRRIVGDQVAPSDADLDAGVAYIRDTPQIRDVLISGGDPLSCSDSRIEYLVSRLRAIPHVELIRIGTRMPVVLPQRVDSTLLEMLRKYHPIWLNTHFNHPLELVPQATRECMERIADAGIPTGNQSVLLRGINDCPVVMRKLVHELLKVRCRPYYIYSCDLSQGLKHFRSNVNAGVSIIRSLQGHTTGFGVPTFVVDAPGGGGKIPVMPQNLVKSEFGKVVLRNYEGKLFEYTEGDAEPHGESCSLCAGHC